MSDYEMSRATEVIKDRVYYIVVRAHPRPRSDIHFFTIDDTLVYWNFFLDFGPLNLGQTFRFCQILNHALKSKEHANKRIYYYSSAHAHKRTNAAWLCSAYRMMYMGLTPEQAFRPFERAQPPFPYFHDASPFVCTYNLSILDCLRGMRKAFECKFFSFEKFDINEYEYFEKVENGDLNWLHYGRFLAFAGPHETRQMTAEGYHTLCPDDYIPYFKKKGVSLVIRLNKKYYNQKRFTNAGIDHLDLYYMDGSTPPKHILEKFIQACESAKGAIAVHCKAGLGRTGTCIGAYMMKHHKFTAAEIIGWFRICRPGSIIGPQQQFMKEIEPKMWKAGDQYYASKRNSDTAATTAGAGAGAGSGAGSSSRRTGAAGSSPDALSGRLSGLSLGARTSAGAGGAYGGRASDGSRARAAARTKPSSLSAAGRMGLSRSLGTSQPRSNGSSSRTRNAGRISPLRSGAASNLYSPQSVQSDTSQGDELRAARAKRGSPTAGRTRSYGYGSRSSKYK